MPVYRPDEILILSDMDGTLIHAPHPVPEGSCEGIRRFTSLGGNFAVATGRAVDSVRFYTKHVPFTAPSITFNGAVLYDYQKGQVLWCNPLPKSVGAILLAVRERFPMVGIELHLAEKLYSFRFNSYLQARQDLEGMRYIHETDPSRVEGDWCKLLFATGPELQPEVLKYIGQIAGNDVYFVPTNDCFIELIAAGVNKGAALTKLRGMLGDRAKLVVAAGDYYNDIELFQHADFRAVPVNAPEDVRALADLLIPPPEECGIATLIEHVLHTFCN